MERGTGTQRRRLAAAVAASLVCHLLVLWFLARAEPPKPKPLPRAPVPVEVRWQLATRSGPTSSGADAQKSPAPASSPPAGAVSAPETEARRSSQSPKTPQASGETPKHAPAAAPSAPKAAQRAAPAPSSPEGAPVPSGEGHGSGEPGGALATDEPRDGRSLTPGYGAMDGILPTPEGPHGHTLHPGDLPSPEEQRAEEEARVGELVEGGAQSLLAEARVKSGLVDPYFGDLRRQLAKSIESAPDFTDAADPKNLPKTWVGSWQTAAQSYGKTGVAYEAPVSRTAPQEIPSVLAQEVARGSPDARAFAMKLYAGARLRDFGQGKMGAELYAEVELSQGPTGALQRLTLVRASGISTFDAWVVEKAASAIDALGPLDAAAHPKGLRSVFGFTGRVSYMRKTGDIHLEKDAPYLLASTVLGLIPGLGLVNPGTVGTFDETTGEGYYVDLRYPHYECQVKLLRVYGDARGP